MTFLDNLLRDLVRLRRQPNPGILGSPPDDGDGHGLLSFFPKPKGLLGTMPAEVPQRQPLREPPQDGDIDSYVTPGQYAANDEGIIPGRVKLVMSPRGQDMIRRPGREGPFHEFAYLDLARNPTIGFGHKITPEDEQYLRQHQGPMNDGRCSIQPGFTDRRRCRPKEPQKSQRAVADSIRRAGFTCIQYRRGRLCTLEIAGAAEC